MGQAIPEGARQGGIGKADATTTARLRRLVEHADSTHATPTLNVDDLVCRFLEVDDIWIPLGESLRIARFSLFWNTSIDGFGNHDPGKGRYNGMRPRWDVLHPGQGWAQRCQPRAELAEHIASQVAARLQTTLPLAKPHFYVEQAVASYRLSATPREAATPEPT